MSLSWRARLLGTKKLGQVFGGSATQDHLWLQLYLPNAPLPNRSWEDKSHSQREAPGFEVSSVKGVYLRTGCLCD